MVINIQNTNTGFIDRTESVSKYLTTVRKFDTLTVEDEKALFDIIKNSKDETAVDLAMKRLVECNQKFVIAAARHYAPTDKFLDCISEGTIGLYEAIKMYDPTQGAKFITFAAHYIRREITQYLRDEDPIIRKSNVSKTFHVLPKAKNWFLQKYEREPSAEELIELLNEKYGCDIKDSIDLCDTYISTINETSDEDDDSVCSTDMMDYYRASSNNNIEDSVESNYKSNVLSSLFNTLKDDEAKIIKMFFGIGYYRTYDATEISEELGIPVEKIRSSKKKIIEKLQKEFAKKSKKI